jgi:hypothetical protein
VEGRKRKRGTVGVEKRKRCKEGEGELQILGPVEDSFSIVSEGAFLLSFGFE